MADDIIPLRASYVRTMVERITELEAEIERLRAAGDALADSVDVALHNYSHEIYNTLPAWREARRG